MIGRSGEVGRALLGALLASALLAPGLGAQAGGERGGRGYFQVGYHALDLDALNLRLGQRGLPSFEEGFVTLGGGGHGQRGRLLIGGEGHGLLEHTQTTGDFQRKLSGGYGFFDLGWVVADPGRAQVYLLGGLGAGGLNLRTAERSLPTFEEVLAEPRRTSDLTVGSFLLQVAAGADVLPRVREGGRGFRGLALGVRGGWIFAPWTGEWQVSGTDAPGGPSVAPAGPWVRILIGGGGGRR